MTEATETCIVLSLLRACAPTLAVWAVLLPCAVSRRSICIAALPACTHFLSVECLSDGKHIN